jgi:hypothetical protein
MTPRCIYMSAILMIALILIAHFTKRCWRKRRGAASVTHATPAAPQVKESAADLFETLKHMVELGQTFKKQVAAATPVAAAAAPVMGARLSATHVIRALEAASRRLGAMAPSHANYLATYHGLASADTSLLAAADAYDKAGRRLDLLMGGVPGAPGVPPGSTLGGTLVGMGVQLRLVVRAVHRLGNDLNLE